MKPGTSKTETSAELERRVMRELREFEARVEARYRPLGFHEQMLVESIARIEWGLSHTDTMIAEFLAAEIPEPRREQYFDQFMRAREIRQRLWNAQYRKLRSAQKKRLRGGKRIALRQKVEYLYVQ